jgi:diacylglycerol kinase (ATP)
MAENGKKFSVNQRLISFKYAYKGLDYLFSTQHNARIHLFAALLAITLGFILQISLFEWCLICIAIVLVFVAELFNTAIEYMTDLISPELHEKAGHAKDLAAAGVLFCAFGSLVLGLIIFLPKIIQVLI